IRCENGTPVFSQLTAARIPEMRNATCDARDLATMLSLDPSDLDVDRSYAIEAWSAGVPFLFVPLKNLDALGRARVKVDLWEEKLRRSWTPDIFVFVEGEESAARNGVRMGEGVIRARMFAPSLGVAEDPATGGACAALGGYLAARSEGRDGMLRYTVHQGVEMGRPSRLEVETDVMNGAVRAVRVGGASVLVSSGTLHVP
ncbi:MAG TPA: PhzF family phenazine biosynthesis isomerase, partial [Gemmatimonadaceae bacterium]|nr:PhzF family phenazine biosynthesis isomerase [Gemmatimonadaceae bacterium]